MPRLNRASIYIDSGLRQRFKYRAAVERLSMGKLVEKLLDYYEEGQQEVSAPVTKKFTSEQKKDLIKNLVTTHKIIDIMIEAMNGE